MKLFAFIRNLTWHYDCLALKNTRGRNFINGAWTIDWPRKFEIAGTTFNYERSATEPETLQALGPTDDDLVIMVSRSWDYSCIIL